MSADREQNGPTQVHPPLQYTDLASHIGIGAQINGTGMMGKSFGEFCVLIRYLDVLKVILQFRK